MERVFTQDVGRLHRKGMRRDLPAQTWNRIADSAGMALDEFSMTLEESAQLNFQNDPVESRPTKRKSLRSLVQ